MDSVPAPERPLTYEAAGREPERRLRELIIFIAHECAYDPTFGATKLNKLLWWADIRAFAQLGQAITGVAYVRLPQGPVPEMIDRVKTALRLEGHIALSPQEHFGRVQTRIVPLRRAELGMFTGPEIAIVERLIRECWNLNAKSVSKRSHGKAWEAIPHQDRMPYESVFLSDDKPTRYDVARTKELAREHGWE